MKKIATILSLILTIQLALSSYVYSNSYSYYSIIKSATLSPINYYNQNSSYVNVAFLYSNGTVQVSHTSSLSSSYSVINPLEITNTIEWNEAGIILVSNSTVSIYDPYSLNKNLVITTSGGIVSAKVAIRNDFLKKIITVVAFSNRIQIFEDTTSKKNLTLTYTFQTMAIDVTGKYLYYFDIYTRYVYDLVFLNSFSLTSTSYNYKQLIGSSKTNNEDITVSIDSYGYVSVWDDYNMLNTYRNTINQNKITFTEDSKYLISVDYSKFYVWLADYQNLSNWKVIQNEFTSNSPKGIDAKNGMFLYYSDYNIYIYRYQNDPAPVPPTSTTVVIIVVSIVGFLICIGVVVVCFKKKKAQNSQNQNYQPFDNQQSGNQGWNNQGTSNQGWNNQGTSNQGWNNQGANNQGWNNQGANNQGWNNQGANNQGWNNQGYSQPYTTNNQVYNPSPIINEGSKGSNPYGWN